MTVMVDRAGALFETMALIRCFEEQVLALFSEAKLSGTTHVCLGQEAVPAAVADHLRPEDIVFSPHRCHGHYLARGGNPEALFAEIMGRADGVCGGRGGSQHLHFNRYFSNGVQGGIVGNAAGAALAQSLGATDGITVVFLGDGTLGEGLVYETLNFVSLRRLPILFVLENNRYAQTTPLENAVSGSICGRAEAFGIAAAETTDRDPLALYTEAGKRIAWVRSERAPFFLVINTYRLGPHSKGDDYRNEAELSAYRAEDPLTALGAKLCPPDAEARLERSKQRVVTALARAVDSPPAPFLRVLNEDENIEFDGASSPYAISDELFVHALNRSLHQLLLDRKEVILLGEDLLDPYGGAFAVYKGLSTAYPERVISTPISEAGLVAWGTGAALFGMRPIVEIMFGDFLLLAADQIVNHAAKYPWLSNGAAPVPLVIRAPMGAGRGYGPTHSQTLECMFMNVPGLRIIAPSPFLDPGELLRRCVESAQGPILFVENKLLYGHPLAPISGGRYKSFFVRASKSIFPTLHFSLTGFATPDGCILCYGGMAPMALDAAVRLLLENEIAVDVVIPSQLAPTPSGDLVAAVGDTSAIVTLEESSIRGGWGAEVLATLAEQGKVPRCVRVGSRPTPPPAAPSLEKQWMPSVKRIIDAVLRAVQVC